MVPLLNPAPGSNWSVYQPSPVFPVTQANDNTAVLLKDPFPETAIVLLPLDQWYGSGTPFILAFNTWYEGRIQEVTGSDVMAIRLVMAGNRDYYSYYSGLEAPDVKLRPLPCTVIPGKSRRQCMMLDDGMLTVYEKGYLPTVQVSDQEAYAHITEPLDIQNMSVAGMVSAYASLSPGAERHYIRCQVTDGASKVPSSAKYVGLATKVDPKICPFYTYEVSALTGLAEPDALDAKGSFCAPVPFTTGESVVHYN